MASRLGSFRRIGCPGRGAPPDRARRLSQGWHGGRRARHPAVLPLASARARPSINILLTYAGALLLAAPTASFDPP